MAAYDLGRAVGYREALAADLAELRHAIEVEVRQALARVATARVAALLVRAPEAVRSDTDDVFGVDQPARSDSEGLRGVFEPV